ncbi:hypothetical protein O3M35_001528 [Rhynocoris fuscipes]|uniref:Fibronectin type-III domain-containing protein n=1 Tax=Rhynocoris fuscipes TaxID=488301 RepID=A0AAW1CP97_9HEMI
MFIMFLNITSSLQHNGIHNLFLISSTSYSSLKIRGLRGEADYRQITLKWEYPRYGVPVYGFQIYYCELQAWGPNRCKTKIIEVSSDMKTDKANEELAYSVIISGLRMATNYSFTVRPMETRRTRYIPELPTRSTIIVSTKGFSAKAILCLPEASEVEVSTGPYFSGRIAVEGAVGPECGVEGDANSSRDTYVLRISHRTCGSSTNSSAVATFILVQENLPILTHSTRRFLVVCTFQPETLTVRAGLNLPHTSQGSVEPQVEDETSRMIEISGNDVHAQALQQDSGTGRAISEETEAQVVVTVIGFIVSIVGLALAVWWYYPARNRSETESILSEESSSPVYENFENSLRDGELNEDDSTINGVCNQVMRESGVYPTGPSPAADHQNCITIETQTASEA